MLEENTKNNIHEKAKDFFLNGIKLFEAESYTRAECNFRLALKLIPDRISLLTNLAATLIKLKKFEEASEVIKKTLALYPNDHICYLNLGNIAAQNNEWLEAHKNYVMSINLDESYAEAYNNNGLSLIELNKLDESIENFNVAINLNPNFIESYYNKANVLQKINRLDEAYDCCKSCLKVNHEFEDILLSYIFFSTKLFLWEGLKTKIDLLKNGIKNEKYKNITPFRVLGVIDDPQIQLLSSQIHSKVEYPADDSLGQIPYWKANGKIRIGYFSADFHNHATAYLMAELFELHDKSKFELYAFSFGPNNDDEMRRRVSNAFDKFIDVTNMGDREVALLSRQLGIDIAIDLKGYTQGNRTGIFAKRCAPLQVSYLGFPGTMGVDYIDYLIADKVVIPENCQQYYSEKIIYMPHSYQVNDSKRVIAERVFTRLEEGIPEKGFVFCCFNNNYKILPDTFNIWMQILKLVKGSVLWLLEDNPTATANLKKEAELRGVDPSRIIFAERMTLQEHLARHCLADLFLDTLPYNAHTTTSDALWAGLPVLTCKGASFAARVAASLLSAVEMTELITETYEEYQAKAIELATNPIKLELIKLKLKSNKLKTPLFDTRLFTKNIELAYESIYQNYHEGLETKHIVI